MSNVDSITYFSELNKAIAQSFINIIKLDDDVELFDDTFSIEKYIEALNNCVSKIEEYAVRPKSTFIVKIIDYFVGQNYFHVIAGEEILFSRSDFRMAEFLIYYNEINNLIVNTVWSYDFELLNDLKPHCIETAPKDIDIKEDELKFYFNSWFLGIGENNINHFESSLLPELQKRKSGKEIATIAYGLFNSKNILSKSKKPATFSRWYEIFCDCIGTNKKTYQPKDLVEPFEKMRYSFPFF